MSNVQSWKRRMSGVNYIYQTYQLNILIGQFVHNAPSKYRKSYGDLLIKECNEALKHGRIANSIHIIDMASYDNRTYELNQMQACVDEASTIIYIWIELMIKYKELDPKDKQKYYNRENKIGGLCYYISCLIEGVKKSDIDLHSNLFKEVSAQ